jgi:hypothetical protein
MTGVNHHETKLTRCKVIGVDQKVLMLQTGVNVADRSRRGVKSSASLADVEYRGQKPT